MGTPSKERSRSACGREWSRSDVGDVVQQAARHYAFISTTVTMSTKVKLSPREFSIVPRYPSGAPPWQWSARWQNAVKLGSEMDSFGT